LGACETELTQRLLADFLEKKDLVSARLAELQIGAAQSFEEVMIDFAGHSVPVLLTASVLANSGTDVHGFVFLAQNITERKRAQEALVAAKEAAEESSRTKSNFMANMSHELRTPLNAIINYTEMLLEDAEAECREQEAADLSRISASSKHLLAVINDILDFSKIEAGRMQVHYETVDLRGVLSEVESTCAAAARNNSTEIVVPETGIASFRGDTLKVKQILLNLVGNACKFTERGTVSVTVEHRSDDLTHLCFAVRDTGTGIAPEDMSKLFRSFSQLDSSSTRRHGGTGLGLSISQQLAALMGGSISAVSKPGAGSTFTLDLPAEEVVVATSKVASGARA
jgi:signal transduction histidine kinase